MKTALKYILILLVFQFATSCLDKFQEEFTAYSPVYMSYEDLRQSVTMTTPIDIKATGKIYFYNNHIFINEKLKGVHVINNEDPSNPVNIGFIEIPGNVDIAIKEDVLYADSYVDLVAIDISDLNNVAELNRVEDVFPYTLPPTDDEYRIAQVDSELGVVIDWEVKVVKQDLEYRYYPMYFGGAFEFDLALNSGGGAPATMGEAFGVGGSMARFGLYNDYLYIVGESIMTMFDVSDAQNPSNIGSEYVGWSIETMFIYDDHIFFGTQSGMIIYSLEVPTVPSYIGQFWHVTSCDPVVVQDGYAYITLRGGNICGSNVNRLDVVELSEDYIDNKLVASYPLNGPYGLGVDGDILFVCDGDAGLKVYAAADKLKIDEHMIKTYPGINAYDVIPIDGNLFMIGEDGFYQYDYSDIQNITLLSFLPIVESGN